MKKKDAGTGREEITAGKPAGGKSGFLPLLVLSGAAALLLVTHAGSKSPYTWELHAIGYNSDARIEGQMVNPDSYIEYLGSDNFYKPVKPRFDLPIIWLPLHSFIVSILLGAVKSFILASYLANLLALALLAAVFSAVCADFGFPSPVIILSGINILLLPFFSDFIGQPMYYICTTALNFILALLFIYLVKHEDHSPWKFGFLLGVLLINYDCYVFAASIIIFLLFYYKFLKTRHYIYFFGAALGIFLAWALFVYVASGGSPDRTSSRLFFTPIFDGWKAYLSNPFRNPVFPYSASYAGIVAAVKQTLGQIYWPLAAAVLLLLVKSGVLLSDSRIKKFLLIIPAVYIAEAMFISLFDWEMNPRRALPVLFVFSCALTYATAKYYAGKTRYLLIGLAVFSFFLAFSDVLFSSPDVQVLQTGEMVRNSPKYIMRFNGRKITRENFPSLHDEKLRLFTYELENPDFEKAGRAGKAKLLALFAFPQLFLGIILFLLLLLCGRAGLVSPRLKWILTGFSALSLALRFVPNTNPEAAYYRSEIMGNCQNFHERRPEAAVETFNKAVELKPGSAEAYYGRGFAYAREGDFPRAIADFEQAAEISPGADTWFYLGNACLENREYDRALKAFEKALRYSPGDARIYYAKGNVFFGENDMQQAIREYSGALELDGGFLKARLNRGNSYVRAGNYDGAAADFTEVLNQEPDNAPALFNRAVANYYRKAYRQAASDAERSRTLGYSVPQEFMNGLQNAINNSQDK